jgi:hypothetical protein
MPDTVQAVLVARIDRVPAAAKRLVQTAAVIGSDVPVGLLQAVVGLPDGRLQGQLQVEHAYTRAYALCQQVGETPELIPGLFGLGRVYFSRVQLHTAREIGEMLLRLARRAHDSALADVADRLGHTADGLQALAEAYTLVEQHEERAWEAGRGGGVGVTPGGDAVCPVARWERL